MMPDKWDGRTERRAHTTDHDNLTRVVVLLENHVKNFDAHVVEDKRNFQDISDKLWGHAKYIYIGIGIIGVVEVLMGMHK